MICPLASLPVPEPDQNTNPRMKTAITANSVHFSWWKLLRIVLSIENPPRQRSAPRMNERATIHRFLRRPRRRFDRRRDPGVGVGAESRRGRGPAVWTGDGR